MQNMPFSPDFYPNPQQQCKKNDALTDMTRLLAGFRSQIYWSDQPVLTNGKHPKYRKKLLDCFANSPLLDHRKCTENSGELINVDARASRVIIFIKYTIFN